MYQQAFPCFDRDWIMGRAIFKNTKVTPEQERFIVAAQKKEEVKHRLFGQFVVFEEKLRK